MLTRAKKRRLVTEEQRVETESEQADKRYLPFRQFRERAMFRAVCRTLPRTRVSFLVSKPVPHRSLKDAWLTMLGDVCVSGIQRLHMLHPRLNCAACVLEGRCWLSKRYFRDYAQHCLMIVALAAYGSRHQLFARASVPVVVEEAERQACVDRWFIVLPPALVQHLRSVGMDAAVTFSEAKALRRLYELQCGVKTALQTLTSEDAKTKLLHQMHHLCSLAQTVSSPKTCDDFRSEVTRQINDATHIHVTMPWGRSRMKADTSKFNGIATATRHLVAQQRNMLTGADKLGMYWRV